MTKKQKNLLIRIVISAVLLVAVYLIPEFIVPKAVLFLIPYLIIGLETLKKAWKGIRKGQAFDEHFLMAVATIGAFILGEYLEAVAVMLFYEIGELFESYAVGKSRRSISDLMDIRPDSANIEREDGSIEEVDPDEVEIGSVIVVRPGEKIPIDGIVEEGDSTLNTAALTGESVPRSVHPGTEVLSGSINVNGLLKIRTTKEFGESTASKILDLVENASSRKSRSENFISRFARIYTPAVCYSAVALAVIPPLVLLALGRDAAWSTWIYRGLTFLVTSCPCALVISIPLSFFAGLGGASRDGILIKGSNYLETLSNVRSVVFDKTGTMTEGVFEVTAIHDSTIPREEFLDLAAHAESYSTHPISESLCRAHGGKIDQSRVENVEEISGHGVKASVDGKQVAVGNRKLMRSIGLNPEKCESVGTIVYTAVDGEYVGHAVISDRIKKESAAAITALKKLGIRKTVMLTGDAKEVAESVGKEIGVDEVLSELLPDQKVANVERMLAEKKAGEALAFVGDGINDAPVLSRADIGIAMGAIGSDAAIEAADVVLMDDNPLKIASAIGISRKCIRIVHENTVFAIGIKLICLLLAAVGIANMWFAIFADVGVMILCVINAIRALNTKGIG